MSARSCAACWVGAVALSLCPARPGFAQRANGPYAPAFGVQPDENRTQGLDLSALFLGAYDQDILPASRKSDLIDPRLTESGASGGVEGLLSYGWHGDRARFALNGGGAVRDYVSSGNLAVVAYQAGTAFSAPVASGVDLSLAGSAQYSPFLQFAPFLDANIANVGPLGPGVGFAAIDERNSALAGSVGLTANMTKSTSVFATVDGRDWQMPDAPENDLRAFAGRAGVRHRLNRSLGLHLAYGVDQSTYAFAGGTPYINQIIDAGVDYGDTLTFSRRTALSFSTSTMATRYLNETYYRLNGSVQLTRGFSRTWSTWVGYLRDTQYRIGFRAPLLADSVNAGLSGLLAWRVKWSVGAGYTRGTIGFGTDGFSAYGGASRFDFALTRTLAVVSQYGFYHYEIPPGSSTLALLPKFSRQVATVGLSLSLPLASRVRPREPQEP